MRGFSLVETLVAISILLVAVTAILATVSRGIFYAGIARDQVAAFYLAQEAAEYIKNKRDTNAIQDSPWLTGFGDCIGSACTVDVTTDVIANCGGTCPVLRLDAATGIYSYDPASEPTIFTRNAQITEIAADKEAFIDVTIRWRNQAIDQAYTTRIYMYNWQ